MGRGVSVTLRYVHHYQDQHGTEKWYFRRAGSPKIRLPAPGSKEFMAAYNRAVAGIKMPERPQIGKAAPGTIAAAITAYYQHNSFTGLAPGTRQMRRAILERFREQDGSKRIAALPPQVVAKIIGARKPFAARNWLKTLRGLMQFAIAIGLRSDGPTAGLKMAKAPTGGGFHSWTEAEIAQYEARHPIGTRARLAMALLLYTAARRGDIVRLGPQHVRQEVLSYRQQKTGRELDIPLHHELAAILKASPSGHLSFLATAAGQSFSAAGFGNLFRQWCNEANLSHCTAHGLRKAQSRRLAEAGCTAPQIASITGHKTLSEVQRYIEAAEQTTLARAAMKTVSRTRIGSPQAPVSQSGKKL
jgi:integrase